MRRGEIWWASLRVPAGSGPGYRRPVLVVQSDDLNDSLIRTTIVVAVASNLRLAEAPGNLFCRRRQTGLPHDSVINVSQILTPDKSFLTDRVRMLSPELFRRVRVEEGLRLVAAL